MDVAVKDWPRRLVRAPTAGDPALANPSHLFMSGGFLLPVRASPLPSVVEFKQPLIPFALNSFRSRLLIYCKDKALLGWGLGLLGIVGLGHSHRPS